MLAFSLLRVGHPGVSVDGSLGTQAIAVAIGSFGGLAIGIREAESITRAQELGDRNEELARRERELEHQNERLDEFTSIVSHDLRNPLNVAQGRLDLARSNVDDDEHLSAVADAHERMEALVDGLLSLARQGETADDDLDPVDVAALARDCWEAVAEPGATLDVPEAGDEFVVHADEQRLRQVLSNLFRNAVEHGDDDGVRVTVGALDDGAGFYVADDGPRIPAEDREQVFDRGYSSSTDGTGFGLAIVARIADAHGWTVLLADGEDGGGACFEFRDVELAESAAPAA
nr:HAMP domain-containing sensor histidine kinase [Halobacterium sp. TGN-42-S1]